MCTSADLQATIASSIQPRTPLIGDVMPGLSETQWGTYPQVLSLGTKC